MRLPRKVENNRKIDTFLRPPKRTHKHQLDQRRIDQFVAPKKRQKLPSDKKQELHDLFDKISNDPFYENEFQLVKSAQEQENERHEKEAATKATATEQLGRKLLTFDQIVDYLWEEDISEDDEEKHEEEGIQSKAIDDLRSIATTLLEEENAEELNQVLASTQFSKTKPQHYQFFSKHCKLPAPALSLTDDISLCTDSHTILKYKYIMNCAKDPIKRHFLITSGMMTTWYQLGWNSTHSIYQWLIEIVAFEGDAFMGDKAMKTILSLWRDALQRKGPLTITSSDGINYSKHVSVQTFYHIIKSYGALDIPIIDEKSNSDCEGIPIVASQTENDTDMEGESQIEKIPVAKLDMILELLGTSLTFWPHAYTLPDLHWIAQVMVCLSLDGVGALLLNRIQNTLSACLLAFPVNDWRTQVQKLSFMLIERFASVDLQVKLHQAMKPACNRSLYLSRVTSLLAVELALLKDKQQAQREAKTDSENDIVDDDSSMGVTERSIKSAPVSPSSSSSASSSSSPLSPAISRPVSFTLESLSPFFTSGVTMLSRLAVIISDSQSIFYQRHPDYHQLSLRVSLLNHVIGSDLTEFMSCLGDINILVTQLKAINRKIGGRLSALDKTVANEVTQRLWSRITYVIGRNVNVAKDNEL